MKNGKSLGTPYALKSFRVPKQNRYLVFNLLLKLL